jgi:hypothetical protein
MASADLEQEQYDELALYTLTHPDPAFIHQYAVDAFAAQHADARTRPITLTFALVGLYLHVERHINGKHVQRVHTLLARHRRSWPAFPLPADRGHLTIADVIAAPPGPARDAMIDRWSACVWQAYRASRDDVVALIRTELG